MFSYEVCSGFLHLYVADNQAYLSTRETNTIPLRGRDEKLMRRVRGGCLSYKQLPTFSFSPFVSALQYSLFSLL